MATIREVLRLNELESRDEVAKKTKFDKPVEIERSGDKIVVPLSVRPEKAVEIITAWSNNESQVVQVLEHINGVPVDAANALLLAVKHEFGVVELQGRESFWGSNPPVFYSIPTSAKGENVPIYVGQFTLPGFEGASLSSAPDDKELRLTVSGMIRRKDMPLFNQLIDTARRFLREQSLYKGKAIKIDFSAKEPDASGNVKMLIPKFWDVSEPRALIVDAKTEAIIDAIIWTPITMPELVRSMGTAIGRAILLYGTYGTGKTLTAYKTAHISVKHGTTFLYVKSVDQLEEAIEFASEHYLPAVLFLEDSERAFEDPAKVATIQTMMDGIDTKSRDLIIVFTTNKVEQLPAGILRPRRIDAVIHLQPCDDVTSVRVVELVAGSLLDPSANKDRIGQILVGNTPAAIGVMVERAKLFALTRAKSIDFKINDSDIELAAKGMEEHMALLGKGVVPASPIELFGGAMGEKIAGGIVEAAAQLVNGGANAREHATQ